MQVRFRTSCYLWGSRGPGVLNLDIPNFNIQQMSDQMFRVSNCFDFKLKMLHQIDEKNKLYLLPQISSCVSSNLKKGQSKSNINPTSFFMYRKLYKVSLWLITLDHLHLKVRSASIVAFRTSLGISPHFVWIPSKNFSFLNVSHKSFITWNLIEYLSTQDFQRATTHLNVRTRRKIIIS